VDCVLRFLTILRWLNRVLGVLGDRFHLPINALQFPTTLMGRPHRCVPILGFLRSSLPTRMRDPDSTPSDGGFVKLCVPSFLQGLDIPPCRAIDSTDGGNALSPLPELISSPVMILLLRSLSLPQATRDVAAFLDLLTSLPDRSGALGLVCELTSLVLSFLMPLFPVITQMCKFLHELCAHPLKRPLGHSIPEIRLESRNDTPAIGNKTSKPRMPCPPDVLCLKAVLNQCTLSNAVHPAGFATEAVLPRPNIVCVHVGPWSCRHFLPEFRAQSRYDTTSVGNEP
jgi:hypothetical protein